MLKIIKYFIAYRQNEYKSRLNYKFDFFIYVFCDFILQLVGIVFIETIFNSINAINGWDKENVILIYGFYCFSYGLFSFIFWPLYDFSYVLYSGEYEMLKIKPISVLVQLLGRGIGDIGGLVTGSSLLVYSVVNGSLVLSFYNCLVLLVSIIFGIIIFLCTYINIAATSFFFPKSIGRFTEVFNYLSMYARYPLNIFTKIIRGLLLYVMPLGFVSYIPISFLKNETEGSLFYISPIIIILYFILTIKFWKLGEKKYVGVGN